MAGVRTFLALACSATVASGAGQVNAYFANWAQYHHAPYKYTPQNLTAIAQDLDVLTYAFAYFCPAVGVKPAYWVDMLGWCNNTEPFSIVASDPKDIPTFYGQVQGLKQLNTKLKTVLSIGGWNFPSAYFSQMASTAANRAAFITSIAAWIDNYKFDGVDIDWEYPCSSSRDNPIKMDCDHFNLVEDEGSQACPAGETGFCAGCADKANLVALVTELRAKLGPGKIITIASQASVPHTKGGFDVVKLQDQIDWFNVMSYDYTVSDSINANVTAANQPVYNTTNPSVVDPWGVDYTIDGYVKLGAKPEKLSLGIALYGHTWFVPGLEGDAWQSFGLTATKQQACCGPYRLTYGASAGAGCALCGSMMFSEIRAAGCPQYMDWETLSHISYCAEDSLDGHTKAGTWISWNDFDSLEMVSKYGMYKKLKGVFIWDTSQDTLDEKAGGFTYEYVKNISGSVRSWTN